MYVCRHAIQRFQERIEDVSSAVATGSTLHGATGPQTALPAQDQHVLPGHADLDCRREWRRADGVSTKESEVVSLSIQGAAKNPTAHRLGRSRFYGEGCLSEHLTINLTPSQRALLEDRAMVACVPLATYVRQLLFGEAVEREIST